MGIVTVVGSSILTVQVTIDGARMESLASAYAQQISDAASAWSFGSIDLGRGSNMVSNLTTGTTQGAPSVIRTRMSMQEPVCDEGGEAKDREDGWDAGSI
ncbi:hypothetical protein [Asaia krungthepensis]|uniref:Uncharacterized protein n=1 Tax=Asaia krungthepensis NRIC 0535 TaxID=1307925 RepID=A0ABQ0Q4D5_9PROT|nr:hypothetical protein [Asaia krungthepensis]GBQ90900.1 hypothetical protein AA0535_2150 [Asaia krungthepensis NRIC 0535]